MASNEKGTKIKDATHLSIIAGTEKLPVSDGSGTPKHVTIADINEYVQSNITPSSSTEKVVNIKQTAWNSLQSSTTALNAFLATYEGYIVNVTEDYTDSGGGETIVTTPTVTYSSNSVSLDKGVTLSGNTVTVTNATYSNNTITIK